MNKTERVNFIISHLEKLFRTLKVLNLDGVYVKEEEAMKSIGKLGELEILRLRGSPGLTPKSIKYIGENENLAKNLTYFNIEQCDAIDDDAIVFIAKTFLNLETLHLSSTKCTGRGFKAISDNLKKLKAMRAISMGCYETNYFECLAARGLFTMNGNY